jgi:hypothetical protein
MHGLHAFGVQPWCEPLHADIVFSDKVVSNAALCHHLRCGRCQLCMLALFHCRAVTLGPRLPCVTKGKSAG